jgi:hypothetical protein
VIGLGTLLASLGAKMVTEVVAKTAAHKVLKHFATLVVVYAKDRNIFTRHFNDHSKAVAFQREIAAHRLPSYLMEAMPDGRLNMEPIVTMNGLGSTWIRSNYALPKGEFSSMVAHQGKQGKHLVRASEYQAQAWADEYGPNKAVIDTTSTPKLPYYDQSYGSTYHHADLPKDIYGSTFYDDHANYNLVNPHNT